MKQNNIRQLRVLIENVKSYWTRWLLSWSQYLRMSRARCSFGNWDPSFSDNLPHVCSGTVIPATRTGTQACSTFHIAYCLDTCHCFIVFSYSPFLLEPVHSLSKGLFVPFTRGKKIQELIAPAMAGSRNSNASFLNTGFCFLLCWQRHGPPADGKPLQERLLESQRPWTLFLEVWAGFCHDSHWTHKHILHTLTCTLPYTHCLTFSFTYALRHPKTTFSYASHLHPSTHACIQEHKYTHVQTYTCMGMHKHRCGCSHRSWIHIQSHTCVHTFFF